MASARPASFPSALHRHRAAGHLHGGVRAGERGGSAGPTSAFATSGIVWFGFWLLMVFNLTFPKGGIKYEHLPITWGYMLLALFAPLAAIGLVRRKNISLLPVIQACCLFLPMGIFIFYRGRLLGQAPSSWMPIVLLFTAFPLMILGLFAPYLENLRAKDIARATRISIRIAIAWGLFNFVLFLLSRNFIEIPYLTVNGADVGQIQSKNNMRGAIMKLVSTYNNGNIFGVCMVMLLPLYFHFEKSRIWLAAFVIALVCTLSRTVWFAMAGTFILMIVLGRIRAGKPGVWLAGLGSMIAFGAILLLLGWDSSNLLDARLGGRLQYLQELEVTIFGTDEILLPEVLYFGLLQSFGLFGLVLTLAAMSFGIIYGLQHWRDLNGLSQSATIGAAGYLICCAMDGAFVFPPVLPLFLIINAMIYRRGFRAADEHALQSRPRFSKTPRPAATA